MKTTIRTILMLLLLTISATVTAQSKPGTFSVTPKIGVSIAKLTKWDWVKGITLDHADSRHKAGFTGGAELQYQATDIIALSVGAMYSMQGVGFDDYAVENGDGTFTGVNNLHLDLQYITMPILFNCYVAKGLALKAGVQPAFLLDARMKSEAAIYTVAEDGMKTYQPVEEIDSKWTTVKSFDVTIPVGISYEYENVVLDARYHFGLTTVFKSGLWSSTNSVFSVTIGYKFDL